MGSEVTYVIGDVGGHADGLSRVLRELGADPVSWALPEGVSVVSVGDLIDRGPESLRAIEIAYAAWKENEGRYIQLIGNHEANWLEKTKAFVFTSDPAAVKMLKSWVREGGLYLAASITGGRPTLVTHAGLTYGLWRTLGSPGDVEEATAAINCAWTNEFHASVIRPGVMLGGDGTNRPAGVYWAEAARELIPSWRGVALPFDMVHGHSSAYDWRGGHWTRANDGERRRLDEQRRHVIVEIGGGNIVGVDPGLGVRDNVSWSAYRVSGTAHVSGTPVTDLIAEDFLRRAY
jgi:hypothetical protein